MTITETIQKLSRDDLIVALGAVIKELGVAVDLDEVRVSDDAYVSDMFVGVTEFAIPAIRKHLASLDEGVSASERAFLRTSYLNSQREVL